jgi:hypothetical protein
VLETDGNPPRSLVELVPGDLFQVLLSFSDQYSCSHSIWSPDSTRILFAGHAPSLSAGSGGVT